MRQGHSADWVLASAAAGAVHIRPDSSSGYIIRVLLANRGFDVLSLQLVPYALNQQTLASC